MFRGRMGRYELLVVTEAFKDKVSREPQMEALRKQALVRIRTGMELDTRFGVLAPLLGRWLERGARA